VTACNQSFYKGKSLMAQLIADRRDVDFVLHEQFDVDKLSKAERFAEFGKKNH